jgi:hypothetical protein
MTRQQEFANKLEMNSDKTSCSMAACWKAAGEFSNKLETERDRASSKT